jgi:glycosyltransferase involved in cell wall biosynthesis
MRHRLLFHPDYRTANPYQTLLYDQLDPAFQVTAGDVDAARSALRSAPWGSRVVFHLHWEDALYRMAPDEASARAQADAFVEAMGAFRDAGGILVWTLHNAQPHDDRWLAVHADLVRTLASACDLALVHGPTAAGWAVRERGIDPHRLAIVPHGHYRLVHRPRPESRAAERAALGLPEAARVLLLIGRLGAYKGAAELLRAFATLDRAEVWLVIAGKQVEPLGPLLAELPEPLRARIRVDDRFLSAAEIDQRLAACDAVVLPYRRILSSGAVLLALGAARPVIVPDAPPLLETVQDGRNGLVYPADRADGLVAALARFVALPADRRAALEVEAARTADGHDWRSSGLVLSGLLRQAIAQARPVRRLG